MEILDDYKEPQKGNLKGFVPYVNLRNEENAEVVGDIMMVLEENEIEFKLKKMSNATNKMLLVPVPSTELSNSSTLIYIKESDKISVDELLDQYYEGPGKKHLEEWEKKAAAAKEEYEADAKQKKRTFFNLAALFLLIVLIWSFVEFCNF
jgi:hypothetical protein